MTMHQVSRWMDCGVCSFRRLHHIIPVLPPAYLCFGTIVSVRCKAAGFEPVGDFDTTDDCDCTCDFCQGFLAARPLHGDRSGCLDPASLDADLHAVISEWAQIARPNTKGDRRSDPSLKIRIASDFDLAIDIHSSGPNLDGETPPTVSLLAAPRYSRKSRRHWVGGWTAPFGSTTLSFICLAAGLSAGPCPFLPTCSGEAFFICRGSIRRHRRSASDDRWPHLSRYLVAPNRPRRRR